MGAGIHTYYSIKMLTELYEVAAKEYPNDPKAINKVIKDAVQIHVDRLKKKYKINQGDKNNE